MRRSKLAPRALLPLLAILAACADGTRGPQDDALEALVERHAPGIVLGEPPGVAARDRYALLDAPYLGFRDSTYVGPDGVHDLMLRVNESLGDERARPSSRARVEAVMLRVEPSAVPQLDARIRAALGSSPTTTCQTLGARSGTERRLWSVGDRRGVLLRVGGRARRDLPDAHAGDDEDSLVIFGRVPDAPDGVTPGPCPPATEGVGPSGHDRPAAAAPDEVATGSAAATLARIGRSSIR